MAFNSTSVAVNGFSYPFESGLLATFGELSGLTFTKTFDGSLYFDLNSSPKTDEISNVVNVKTFPLIWDTEETDIFTSDSLYTIPIGETELVVTIKFESIPVDPDTVVTTEYSYIGNSSITAEEYYAWGGYVTVTGVAGNTFKLSATGVKATLQDQDSYKAEDADSILEYGRQLYEFEDNHLVQTIDMTKLIADTLVDNYKDVRQDVSIDWPGDCIVELSDTVKCQEYKDDSIETIGDFYIVRQNITFDGSLNVTTDLRRV